MPCRASSGSYGGQTAPNGVSLYGADCARHDLAGAKNTEENGTVCSQGEKEWDGSATESGAAEPARQGLQLGLEHLIRMCMRLRPAQGATSLDSSDLARFDFREFKAYVLYITVMAALSSAERLYLGRAQLSLVAP